jgi:hypothetical protein
MCGLPCHSDGAHQRSNQTTEGSSNKMASVFFSYSHKDEALRDQLESHLALLRNEGLIDAWHDRRIVAGDEFDSTIFSNLEAADVILLLVSSDFMNSAYCFSREMKRAMERHHEGSARVIPVILRQCDWQSAPFGKLMVLPQDGKPVVLWADRDEAFTNVARSVRAAVTQAGGRAAHVAAAHPSRPVSPVEVAAVPASRELFPRSSNLRLKKEFTEQDRDEFVLSTYDFICRFFDGSVAAIRERNPGVSGRYERIDTRRMAATLYRDGKSIAQCSVRLDGFGGRSNGIAFSHDASARSGSFNEMLSVATTDQALYMKPMGMSFVGNAGDKHLSQEGAAEMLWGLFMRNAQQ